MQSHFRTITVPGMERDSAASKRRLLDASEVEFAEHGLAGARVARIAASAGVNKQLIYAYFGDKVGLFDAVLDMRYTDVLRAVPFDPDDVVGYVGNLFDYITANPRVIRLAAWKRLERPPADGVMKDDHLPWLQPLKQAQSDGRIDDKIDPSNLAVLLFGMASAWDSMLAPQQSSPESGDTSAGFQAHARYRRDLVEAARRIMAPSAERPS